MNNPMSMAGTVPARKEHTVSTGPSPINLGRCEAGALHTIRKIDDGRPFQCIRHPDQGTAMAHDCTHYTRRLCAECSTGRIVRSRAGVSERRFTIPKEDDVAKTKPRMIVCPQCGRTMEEKARGVCGRCYRYVATGQNVPPLPPELQPKKSGAKAKPKTAPKPETPEQLGPLDDFPDTIQAERVVAGISEQIVAEVEDEELTIDLGAVIDQGFADQDEILQVMADFAGAARHNYRTPETQLFLMMRNVAQQHRLYDTDKECRCGA